MDILFTFTGFHDPYFKGLIDQVEQQGPILSLLNVRQFNHVFLFDTPNTEKISKEVESAINSLHKECEVHIKKLSLSDPTCYDEILKGLRTFIPGIIETYADAQFFVSVASGTPQMHASWVLLTASAEFPARILHVRPPKYITKERPLVSELNFSSPEFPTIRYQKSTISSEEGQANVEQVINQLGIVGDHASMKRCLEVGATLAPSTAPILILGETGTGKELFAKYVHMMSGRPKDKLVSVNCAAIPDNLVESHLFGHKKGAFTGAVNDQIGKFERADKGTLFLDELGELPHQVQAKLLRVLQDGIVESIGNTKQIKTDVRVIAATNKDIRRMIRSGKFREDLYFRLNVGEISLPALRDRRSDIPKLALYILDKVNASIRRPKRLSTEALLRLQSHTWEGNVRDLENVIERSVRLCGSDVLKPDDLLITEPISYADPFEALPTPYEGFNLDDFLSSARKQLLLRALDSSNGNQSQAARLLGVSPQAVHKFIQQSKQKT